MRVNHTYGHGGALAYLAAYDVHQAKVFSRTEPTTGIEAFERLVTHVMEQEPYASAERVFWIVDNGSSHRGKKAADRLRATYPNAVLVHTPIHASWLNQVEIYFSVVQRKVVTPSDFLDLDQIHARLAAFESRYNAVATPSTESSPAVTSTTRSEGSTPTRTAPKTTCWPRNNPGRTYDRDH